MTSPLGTLQYQEIRAAWDAARIGHSIDWEHAASNPVALVILPLGPGCTIVKEDADGTLRGCRDVAPGSYHHDIVAAWINGAIRDGLPVKDYRRLGKEAS